MPVRRLLLLAVVAAPAAAQVSADADLAGRRAEYAARARKLADDDVVGHFALACWCAEKDLQMARRWELRRVLQHAPDHIGARRMLGQVKRDGQWVDAAAAARAGKVLVDGRWMRKYEAARWDAARERGPTVEQRREADRLLVRLAAAGPAVRRESLAHLEALAVAAAWPELAVRARARHRAYEEFWRTHAYPVTTVGLLDIRLQRSRLLGLDTFTTSLGPGTPVSLQLPRMETISIGTTVPVPLGRR